MKKKIVVHTESSRGWGGQEIRILEEMRGLPPLGFDTILAAPEESRIFKTAIDEGLRAEPVAFDGRFDFSSLIRLTRLFRRVKPAIVNTHSSIDAWIAGAAARVAKVPLIVRTRHVSTPIGSSFSYKYLSDCILTTSEAIRSHLAERGIDRRRIVALPTGIDTKKFARRSEDRDKIRNEYGVGENDVLVGNLCVLRSWKGLDFFIETAAVAPKPFKFTIAGDGPQRERLEKKAESSGLRGRLFFTGYQDRPERFFSAMDIFFFTSYASEGISQALLQALSTGLPVVARRTPSIEEILCKADGVALLSDADPQAAVDALKAMAAGFTKSSLSEGNGPSLDRTRLLNEFSLGRMLGRLPGIYSRFGVGP